MRAVVCLVTYNERENIAWMIEHILAQDPRLDVLVVDDHSPDGTGEVVDAVAARQRRVSIVHRPGKGGYGSAVLRALRTALQRGYDLVLTMDADRSHDPGRLPAMLRALRACDLVIGSRYRPGGGTRNWPLARLVQSRLANLYVRAPTSSAARAWTASPTSGTLCSRRSCSTACAPAPAWSRCPLSSWTAQRASRNCRGGRSFAGSRRCWRCAGASERRRRGNEGVRGQGSGISNEARNPKP